MNVFRRITLRSLKENKVRTLVTIIGIILSAAMFTAVTTFSSSLYNYAYDGVLNYMGSWHGMAYSADSEKLYEIDSDKAVDTISSAQIIGYGLTEGSMDAEDMYKPYLYIMAPDKSFEENMPLDLIAGRMPETNREIVIDEYYQRANSHMNLKPGDKITVELGVREFDGEYLNQLSGLQWKEDGSIAENFIVSETVQYTIVGVMSRLGFENYSAAGCTAITAQEEGWTGGYDVYFTLDKPKEIYSYLNSLSDQGYTCEANTDVLMFEGVSGYESFYTVLYSFMAIFIALIMFGSISLIYNAFAISVSERTKQFGLLSSIGATKKQLGKSVIFEAMAVAAVGIPLGILSGILGIGVTLHFIGDKFASIFSGSQGAALTLNVDVLSIVLAFVITLITVLISAYIPARRAKKVSAIEAIRQSGDIKINPKKVKTSKLTYKLFGLEGMIASKSYKRNKKRYRATVISLFMSIVLFISASAFCNYLTGGVEGVFTKSDNDITYYYDGDEYPASELYEKLKKVEGISKSGYSHVAFGLIETDESIYSERYLDSLSEYPDQEINIHAAIVSVTDDNFREFLSEQGLSEAEYMNPDAPKLVASGQISKYFPSSKKFENFSAFSVDKAEIELVMTDYDKFDTLSEDEKEIAYENDLNDYQVKVPLSIGHIGSELSYGLYEAVGEGVTIMVPESLIDSVFTQPELITDRDAQFYFSGNDHKVLYENLVSACGEMGINSSRINNIAAIQETNRNLILIINVFSYGFITLISLIAVANVFNTISTNIALRRREFAMLKSVGMTQKGFHRMSNYECILYGVKALLYGLPVSAGTTYLMYKSINSGWETSYSMPLVPTLIAIGSVFAIVFITMMYSMGKIRKDNPIDALKNENA